MTAPVFATLNASSPVKAVFGSSPLRAYPFGAAPQKGQPGYAIPYVVFQVVVGTPENYLGQRPDLDGWRYQLDVYDETEAKAEASAKLIRDAVEGVAYVVSFNGNPWDEATALFRQSFDVSFQTPRT